MAKKHRRRSSLDVRTPRSRQKWESRASGAKHPPRRLGHGSSAHPKKPPTPLIFCEPVKDGWSPAKSKIKAKKLKGTPSAQRTLDTWAFEMEKIVCHKKKNKHRSTSRDTLPHLYQNGEVCCPSEPRKHCQRTDRMFRAPSESLLSAIPLQQQLTALLAKAAASQMVLQSEKASPCASVASSRSPSRSNVRASPSPAVPHCRSSRTRLQPPQPPPPQAPAPAPPQQAQAPPPSQPPPPAPPPPAQHPQESKSLYALGGPGAYAREPTTAVQQMQQQFAMSQLQAAYERRWREATAAAAAAASKGGAKEATGTPIQRPGGGVRPGDPDGYDLSLLRAASSASVPVMMASGSFHEMAAAGGGRPDDTGMQMPQLRSLATAPEILVGPDGRIWSRSPEDRDAAAASSVVGGGDGYHFSTGGQSSAPSTAPPTTASESHHLLWPSTPVPPPTTEPWSSPAVVVDSWGQRWLMHSHQDLTSHEAVGGGSYTPSSTHSQSCHHLRWQQHHAPMYVVQGDNGPEAMSLPYDPDLSGYRDAGSPWDPPLGREACGYAWWPNTSPPGAAAAGWQGNGWEQRGGYQSAKYPPSLSQSGSNPWLDQCPDGPSLVAQMSSGKLGELLGRECLPPRHRLTHRESNADLSTITEMSCGESSCSRNTCTESVSKTPCVDEIRGNLKNMTDFMNRHVQNVISAASIPPPALTPSQRSISKSATRLTTPGAQSSSSTTSLVPCPSVCALSSATTTITPAAPTPIPAAAATGTPAAKSPKRSPLGAFSPSAPSLITKSSLGPTTRSSHTFRPPPPLGDSGKLLNPYRKKPTLLPSTKPSVWDQPVRSVVKHKDDKMAYKLGKNHPVDNNLEVSGQLVENMMHLLSDTMSELSGIPMRLASQTMHTGSKVRRPTPYDIFKSSKKEAERESREEEDDVYNATERAVTKITLAPKTCNVEVLCVDSQTEESEFDDHNEQSFSRGVQVNETESKKNGSMNLKGVLSKRKCKPLERRLPRQTKTDARRQSRPDRRNWKSPPYSKKSLSFRDSPTSQEFKPHGGKPVTVQRDISPSEKKSPTDLKQSCTKKSSIIIGRDDKSLKSGNIETPGKVDIAVGSDKIIDMHRNRSKRSKSVRFSEETEKEETRPLQVGKATSENVIKEKDVSPAREKLRFDKSDSSHEIKKQLDIKTLLNNVKNEIKSIKSPAAIRKIVIEKKSSSQVNQESTKNEKGGIDKVGNITCRERVDIAVGSDTVIEVFKNKSRTKSLNNVQDPNTLEKAPNLDQKQISGENVTEVGEKENATSENQPQKENEESPTDKNKNEQDACKTDANEAPIPSSIECNEKKEIDPNKMQEDQNKDSDDKNHASLETNVSNDGATMSEEVKISDEKNEKENELENIKDNHTIVEELFLTKNVIDKPSEIHNILPTTGKEITILCEEENRDDVMLVSPQQVTIQEGNQDNALEIKERPPPLVSTRRRSRLATSNGSQEAHTDGKTSVDSVPDPVPVVGTEVSRAASASTTRGIEVASTVTKQREEADQAMERPCSATFRVPRKRSRVDSAESRARRAVAECWPPTPPAFSAAPDAATAPTPVSVPTAAPASSIVPIPPTPCSICPETEITDPVPSSSTTVVPKLPPALTTSDPTRDPSPNRTSDSSSSSSVHTVKAASSTGRDPHSSDSEASHSDHTVGLEMKTSDETTVPQIQQHSPPLQLSVTGVASEELKASGDYLAQSTSGPPLQEHTPIGAFHGIISAPESEAYDKGISSKQVHHSSSSKDITTGRSSVSQSKTNIRKRLDSYQVIMKIRRSKRAVDCTRNAFNLMTSLANRQQPKASRSTTSQEGASSKLALFTAAASANWCKEPVPEAERRAETTSEGPTTDIGVCGKQNRVLRVSDDSGTVGTGVSAVSEVSAIGDDSEDSFAIALSTPLPPWDSGSEPPDERGSLRSPTQSIFPEEEYICNTPSTATTTCADTEAMASSTDEASESGCPTSDTESVTESLSEMEMEERCWQDVWKSIEESNFLQKLNSARKTEASGSGRSRRANNSAIGPTFCHPPKGDQKRPEIQVILKSQHSSDSGENKITPDSGAFSGFACPSETNLSNKRSVFSHITGDAIFGGNKQGEESNENIKKGTETTIIPNVNVQNQKDSSNDGLSGIHSKNDIKELFPSLTTNQLLPKTTDVPYCLTSNFKEKQENEKDTIKFKPEEIEVKIEGGNKIESVHNIFQMNVTREPQQLNNSMKGISIKSLERENDGQYRCTDSIEQKFEIPQSKPALQANVIKENSYEKHNFEQHNRNVAHKTFSFDSNPQLEFKKVRFPNTRTHSGSTVRIKSPKQNGNALNLSIKPVLTNPIPSICTENNFNEVDVKRGQTLGWKQAFEKYKVFQKSATDQVQVQSGNKTNKTIKKDKNRKIMAANVNTTSCITENGDDSVVTNKIEREVQKKNLPSLSVQKSLNDKNNVNNDGNQIMTTPQLTLSLRLVLENNKDKKDSSFVCPTKIEILNASEQKNVNLGCIATCKNCMALCNYPVSILERNKIKNPQEVVISCNNSDDARNEKNVTKENNNAKKSSFLPEFDSVNKKTIKKRFSKKTAENAENNNKTTGALINNQQPRNIKFDMPSEQTSFLQLSPNEQESKTKFNLVVEKDKPKLKHSVQTRALTDTNTKENKNKQKATMPLRTLPCSETTIKVRNNVNVVEENIENTELTPVHVSNKRSENENCNKRRDSLFNNSENKCTRRFQEREVDHPNPTILIQESRNKEQQINKEWRITPNNNGEDKKQRLRILSAEVKSYPRPVRASAAVSEINVDHAAPRNRQGFDLDDRTWNRVTGRKRILHASKDVNGLKDKEKNGVCDEQRQPERDQERLEDPQTKDETRKLEMNRKESRTRKSSQKREDERIRNQQRIEAEPNQLDCDKDESRERVDASAKTQVVLMVAKDTKTKSATTVRRSTSSLKRASPSSSIQQTPPAVLRQPVPQPPSVPTPRVPAETSSPSCVVRAPLESSDTERLENVGPSGSANVIGGQSFECGDTKKNEVVKDKQAGGSGGGESADGGRGGSPPVSTLPTTTGHGGNESITGESFDADCGATVPRPGPEPAAKEPVPDNATAETGAGEGAVEAGADTGAGAGLGATPGSRKRAWRPGSARRRRRDAASAVRECKYLCSLAAVLDRLASIYRVADPRAALDTPDYECATEDEVTWDSSGCGVQIKQPKAPQPSPIENIANITSVLKGKAKGQGVEQHFHREDAPPKPSSPLTVRPMSLGLRASLMTPRSPTAPPHTRRAQAIKALMSPASPDNGGSPEDTLVPESRQASPAAKPETPVAVTYPVAIPVTVPTPSIQALPRAPACKTIFPTATSADPAAGALCPPPAVSTVAAAPAAAPTEHPTAPASTLANAFPASPPRPAVNPRAAAPPQLRRPSRYI